MKIFLKVKTFEEIPETPDYYVITGAIKESSETFDSQRTSK